MNAMDAQLDNIRFGPDGLLPAVVQNASDGAVLMLVEMNREALATTLETGYAHIWSRPQQRLFKLGEDSGQAQHVVGMTYDGGGALLMQVRQTSGDPNPSSHFTRPLTRSISGAEGDAPPSVTEMPAALYDLILNRRDAGVSTSYVHRLFQRGQDVICKKVAEEAAEVVIASKNQASAEIVYEMADLWFHATVLLGYHTIHPHEVWRELQRRFGQPGGGKTPAAEPSAAPTEAEPG